MGVMASLEPVVSVVIPKCTLVVAELLNRAEDNGYYLRNWPPHEVVQDLFDYADHELQGFSEAEVSGAVKLWQKSRR